MGISVTTPAIDYSSLMFDATAPNARYIPRDAFAVGGYVNGANASFIWTAAQWNMFPNSVHVRINVTGDPTLGNALDVETGDATPADISDWIHGRDAAHERWLLLYCNRTNLAACMAARSVSRPTVPTYMWVATLDGTIQYDRAITQAWQSKPEGGGAAVTDVSVILGAGTRKHMAGG
jgi:hypothetical protein